MAKTNTQTDKAKWPKRFDTKTKLKSFLATLDIAEEYMHVYITTKICKIFVSVRFESFRFALLTLSVVRECVRRERLR